MLPPQPRFQSLDASDFSDGNIPVYNADVGKFIPVGGPSDDGVTLRLAQILTDEGPPATSTGLNGDFYLDQISGDYYSKQAGTWIHKGNLKGAPGGVGDKGPLGDKGPQGDPGLSGIPSNNADLVHLTDYFSAIPKYGHQIPYQSELHNYLYQGDKRYEVTSTGFLYNFDFSSLFNGQYEGGLTLDTNQTGVITIDLTAKGEYPNGSNMIYTDGFLFVYFYYVYIPQNVTARVQVSDGTWWDCPQATVIGTETGQIWRIPTNAYNFRNFGIKYEITITARSDRQAMANEIEGVLFYPVYESFSGLSRNQPQALYHPWSWRDTNNAVRAEIRPDTGRITSKSDVVCDDPTRGLVLKSPNGQYWRLLINNDGTTYTTPLGTAAPYGF